MKYNVNQASLGEEVKCNLPSFRGNLDQNALISRKTGAQTKEFMLTRCMLECFILYPVHESFRLPLDKMYFVNTLDKMENERVKLIHKLSSEAWYF